VICERCGLPAVPGCLACRDDEDAEALTPPTILAPPGPPGPTVQGPPPRIYYPPPEPWEEAETESDEAEADDTPDTWRLSEADVPAAPRAGDAGPARFLVVGLTGLAGAGKSTIAASLVARALERGESAVRVSFADALRRHVESIFGIDPWYLTTQQGKQSRPLAGRTHTTRQILVLVGQGARALDPDVWVRHARARIREAAQSGASLVVIDDVRLPNEAALVRYHAGVLVELRAEPEPVGWFAHARRWLHRRLSHPTERPWALRGRVVLNTGTVEDAVRRIEAIAAEPFWGRP
jgi:hypothetical protein